MREHFFLLLYLEVCKGRLMLLVKFVLGTFVKLVTLYEEERGALAQAAEMPPDELYVTASPHKAEHGTKGGTIIRWLNGRYSKCIY